jgi:hypothetical protein
MIATDIRNFVVPTSSHIPSLGTRLYLENLPDSVTYPCAALFSVSLTEMHEAEVYTERFQFTCFANYNSSAVEIAEAIKGKLKRFYGAFSTTSTYTVINSVVDNTAYLYDSNVLKHVQILDMIIRYRRQ